MNRIRQILRGRDEKTVASISGVLSLLLTLSGKSRLPPSELPHGQTQAERKCVQLTASKGLGAAASHMSGHGPPPVKPGCDDYSCSGGPACGLGRRSVAGTAKPRLASYPMRTEVSTGLLS